MAYWLMKSEPTTYGIEDLAGMPNRRDYWDGIRNYQVRNWLRDTMAQGDEALFYHSNCKVPAVVGRMRIISDGYPDSTAWDPESPYYDPKSTPEEPRWYRVDVELDEIFQAPVPLATLKAHPGLEDLALVKRGNRLSIMPVSPEHWAIILGMAECLARGEDPLAGQ